MFKVLSCFRFKYRPNLFAQNNIDVLFLRMWWASMTIHIGRYFFFVLIALTEVFIYIDKKLFLM